MFSPQSTGRKMIVHINTHGEAVAAAAAAAAARERERERESRDLGWILVKLVGWIICYVEIGKQE